MHSSSKLLPDVGTNLVLKFHRIHINLCYLSHYLDHPLGHRTYLGLPIWIPDNQIRIKPNCDRALPLRQSSVLSSLTRNEIRDLLNAETSLTPLSPEEVEPKAEA